MFVFACIGYANGNLGQMLAPINGQGDFCGYGNQVGFGYLYIYDLTPATENPDAFWSYGICVESCPSSTGTINCPSATEVTTDCGNSDTRYDTTNSFGYCIPNEDSLTTDEQNDYSNFLNSYRSSIGGDFLVDIYREKWIILMGVGFTLVYTLIYIKFMDYCAFCISWFSMILIQVAFVGIGLGVYYWGQDLEETN
eukprot:CAMPEP_0116879372 /NCGR_PEP_ID=MMETSP0463-20121206/11175_1 /TAXON_ID=181622 /ORGANISM="Strombidinopsis sp, Strain SopsisLIS2011" /LENGTH=195 /DNA_ID=CAMNT_0004528633 /DNA_START=297 /DNA_END=884 /DNA_ORIENTATION=+